MADRGDDKPRPNKAAYDVGYGHPPEKSRFKPGQSGNSNGRPKGAKNKPPIDPVMAALERMIRVQTSDGKTKRMSVIAAIANRVVKDALNGDPKAQKLVLDYSSKAKSRPEPEPPQRVGVVVVRQPAATSEEWKARAASMSLPANPLEGLPGIDPSLLDRPLKRRLPPEDD